MEEKDLISDGTSKSDQQVSLHKFLLPCSSDADGQISQIPCETTPNLHFLDMSHSLTSESTTDRSLPYKCTNDISKSLTVEPGLLCKCTDQEISEGLAADTAREINKSLSADPGTQCIVKDLVDCSSQCSLLQYGDLNKIEHTTSNTTFEGVQSVNAQSYQDQGNCAESQIQDAAEGFSNSDKNSCQDVLQKEFDNQNSDCTTSHERLDSTQICTVSQDNFVKSNHCRLFETQEKEIIKVVKHAEAREGIEVLEMSGVSAKSEILSHLEHLSVKDLSALMSQPDAVSIIIINDGDDNMHWLESSSSTTDNKSVTNEFDTNSLSVFVDKTNESHLLPVSNVTNSRNDFKSQNIFARNQIHLIPVGKRIGEPITNPREQKIQKLSFISSGNQECVSSLIIHSDGDGLVISETNESGSLRSGIDDTESLLKDEAGDTKTFVGNGVSGTEMFVGNGGTLFNTNNHLQSEMLEPCRDNKDMCLAAQAATPKLSTQMITVYVSSPSHNHDPKHHNQTNESDSLCPSSGGPNKPVSKKDHSVPEVCNGFILKDSAFTRHAEAKSASIPKFDVPNSPNRQLCSLAPECTASLNVLPTMKRGQSITSSAVTNMEVDCSSNDVIDNSPQDIAANYSDSSMSSSSSDCLALKQGVQEVSSSAQEAKFSGKVSNSLGLLDSAMVYRCAECDYASANKHYYKQHVDLVHKAARPYKCPFCDYAGKRSHALREHLVVHSVERPYSCEHCNATFRKKSHLTNHTKLHALTPGCGSAFAGNLVVSGFVKVLTSLPSQQTSRLHTNPVITEVLPAGSNTSGNVSCSLSPRGMITDGSTSRAADRLVTVVKENGSEVSCFWCALCKQELVDAHSFQSHLKSVHETDCLYMCERCDFVAAEKASVLAHLSSHLTDTATAAAVDSSSGMHYSCTQCGFVTTSMEALVLHISNNCTHTSQDPSQGEVQQEKLASKVMCSECGYVADSTELMRSHMWMHLDKGSGNDMKNYTISSTNREEGPNIQSSTGHCNLDLSLENSPPDFKTLPDNAAFKCTECNYVDRDSSIFVKHMLLHKTRQSQAARAKIYTASNLSCISSPDDQSNKGTLYRVKPVTTENTCQNSDSSPFVHDEKTGRFRCTICSYTCEYQRTIKAHIWKHSGHQQVDYPIFQNGPLSVYEDPISLLGSSTSNGLSVSATVASIKPASMKESNHLVPTFSIYSSGQQTIKSSSQSSAVFNSSTLPLNVKLVKLSSPKILHVPQNSVSNSNFKLLPVPQTGLQELQLSAVDARSKHNMNTWSIPACQSMPARSSVTVNSGPHYAVVCETPLVNKKANTLNEIDVETRTKIGDEDRMLILSSEKQKCFINRDNTVSFLHESIPTGCSPIMGKNEPLISNASQLLNTVEDIVLENACLDKSSCKSRSLDILDSSSCVVNTNTSSEKRSQKVETEQALPVVDYINIEATLTEPPMKADNEKTSLSKEVLFRHVLKHNIEDESVKDVAPLISFLPSMHSDEKSSHKLENLAALENNNQTIKIQYKENTAKQSAHGEHINCSEKIPHVAETADGYSSNSVQQEANSSLIIPNVVVEAVHTLPSSSLTGLQGQQNSPIASQDSSPSSPDTKEFLTVEDKSMSMFREISGIDIQTSFPASGQEGKRDSAHQVKSEFEVKHADATTRILHNCKKLSQLSSNQQSSDKESAATLLSLLKKQPDFSSLPSCGISGSNTQEYSKYSTDSVIGIQSKQGSDKILAQQDESNYEDTTSEGDITPLGQMRAGGRGICSSLLAVIEQLRERSRSESDAEDKSSQTLTKKRTSRRRGRQDSQEEALGPDDSSNIEHLGGDQGLTYRCRLCHYTSQRIPLIRLHMRTHRQKDPFECSLCSVVADSSEALQEHMIQHCKVRTYPCKFCPQSFNHKSTLRAHMRAHNELDPFLCDICEFETVNPLEYRAHMQKHTGRTFFRCSSCPVVFASQFDLQTHLASNCSLSVHSKHSKVQEGKSVREDSGTDLSGEVTSREQMACSKCKFLTHNAQDLYEHMACHTPSTGHGVVMGLTGLGSGGGTLQCALCEFTAVSSRSLKSHMKRHANDQRYVQQPLEQYKCALCGYVCHHLPSLKSHMWRHASDANYSYQFTNDVINAAIDYDTRADTTVCLSSAAGSSSDQEEPELLERVLSAERRIMEGQLSKAVVGGSKPVCWVTFRCCQCGFETINKAKLNLHMRTHADIINRTLKVNMSTPSDLSDSTFTSLNRMQKDNINGVQKDNINGVQKDNIKLKVVYEPV